MKLSKKFSYITNERWPAVVYLTRTICSLVMRQAIWALICPENCRIIVSIWETAHLPLPSSINTNALSVDCCWVRGRVGAQLLSHETEGGGGIFIDPTYPGSTSYAEVQPWHFGLNSILLCSILWIRTSYLILSESVDFPSDCTRIKMNN